MEEKKLPKRKPTRLRNFDYGGCGTYFVTICTADRKPVLSQVVESSKPCGDNVGQGLAPADIVLLPCGRIVEEQLLRLEKRFSAVTVDCYVIMPDHVHAVISVWYEHGTAEATHTPENPCVFSGDPERLCPTLSRIVGVFKSLSTRACNRSFHTGKLFQSSFYDHIIRNEKDYEKNSRLCGRKSVEMVI